jgi:hypothetical protein
MRTDWVLREELGPDLELELKLCILDMFKVTVGIINMHWAEEVILNLTTVMHDTVTCEVFYQSDEDTV